MLNGGGLAQLQTINHEVGIALEGREDGIQNTLTQLDTFIGGLDEQKAEINRALDSVNNLAATLADRTATIETALDTIGPGLDVINDQRALLVDMLQSLARLGDVGTRIINQSAANTIADLQSAPADPHPARGGRAEPGPLAAAAADLSVPRQLPVGAELPRRTDRRVRPVHQHDRDDRPGPVQPALPVRDRPGHRRHRGAATPRTLVGDQCGQAGTPPGNQGSTQSEQGFDRRWRPCRATSPGPYVGNAPTGDAGVAGLPQVPGGQG